MRLPLASLIVGISLVVFPVRSASACKPAPNHSLNIAGDDSPACVALSNHSTYEAAELTIDNQCTEVFQLSGNVCTDCDASLSVEPGTQAMFVVERREQASKSTLTWETGGSSGEVLVEVAWSDNTGACDRLGCQVSEPNRNIPWYLGLGCLVVGGLVRRRTIAQ